jgi:hypothetical protein
MRDGVRRGTVDLETSVSLDGFVAGPNVSPEQPTGRGAGTSVHTWMFSGKNDAEPSGSSEDFASGAVAGVV